MDFNGCLFQLRDNVDIFFGDHEEKTNIHSMLEDARKIRNNYSHQDFDVER